jgi:hypothetical protein
LTLRYYFRIEEVRTMGRAVQPICPKCGVNHKKRSNTGVQYGYCEQCLTKYQAERRGQIGCQNVFCPNTILEVLLKQGFRTCVECSIRQGYLIATGDQAKAQVLVEAFDESRVIEVEEEQAPTPELADDADMAEAGAGKWGPPAA